MPGEEENQQEEIHKEMQRDPTSDSGNEGIPHKSHNKETEPDSCWILPLLWNHGQLPEYQQIQARGGKEPVQMAEPQEPEEKLQLGGI